MTELIKKLFWVSTVIGVYYTELKLCFVLQMVLFKKALVSRVFSKDCAGVSESK